MSNRLQKILIVLVAVSFTCFGLWRLQRGWADEDLTRLEADPEVERHVLELLDGSVDAGYQQKVAIFYEIRGIGKQAVPTLVRALDDPHPEIRALAVNVLQYEGNYSVVRDLQARLADESPYVRKSALLALGHLGAVETVPAIILVLNDKDRLTRCQAAHVLGVLKDEQAVYPLVRILEKDSFSFARQTAANSLGEIGDEGAVPPLINSLGDDETLVRSASLVALNRITGETLGPHREQWTNWWDEKHLP